MSKLVTVPLSQVQANPHRNIETYPFIPKKIEALRASIKDVGAWERVIARPHGDGYQAAFGHHLIEAMRQEGVEDITIIVRDLDDGEMLRFMGRENGEDYNADFLVMLETWDAAVRYMSTTGLKTPQPLEIATFLGWTRSQSGNRADLHLNHTAAACNAAHTLIRDGHLTREDLAGLSVSMARDLCQRAATKITNIQKVATVRKVPVQDTDAAVGDVVKAVKNTITALKDPGRTDVSAKTAASELDIETVKQATARQVKTPKPAPLFDVQLDGFAKQLAKVLDQDSAGTKLRELAAALKIEGVQLNLAAQHSIEDVQHELRKIAGRAKNFEGQLDVNRVVPLKGVK